MNIEYWKEHAIVVARIIIAAIITTAFILAGLNLIYGEQTRREREVAEALLASTRANICVLALPVTEEGRPETRVNSTCLVPNNQHPFDVDGDGWVEFAGRRVASGA